MKGKIDFDSMNNVKEILSKALKTMNNAYVTVKQFVSYAKGVVKAFTKKTDDDYTRGVKTENENEYNEKPDGLYSRIKEDSESIKSTCKNARKTLDSDDSNGFWNVIKKLHHTAASVITNISNRFKNVVKYCNDLDKEETLDSIVFVNDKIVKNVAHVTSKVLSSVVKISNSVVKFLDENQMVRDFIYWVIKRAAKAMASA